MVIGLKDTLKLIGISVVACCAIFVCTLFLSYNIDLKQIDGTLPTMEAIILYQAQVSMGKVTCAVTGGCLCATSAVMLLFYVKNYIDAHGKELGILKALGYSDKKIAKHFWIFGFCVLTGCLVGFLGATLYRPSFYAAQNADGLFPEVPINVHPELFLLLVLLPAAAFALLSVLYADLILKRPVLDLIKERRQTQTKHKKKDDSALPFLQTLRRSTVRDKKLLAFFIAFSAFCFSAMTQMSMSMLDLSGATFAGMILSIGLILAFVTLFLSLSAVVKGNTKPIAMMRVFGYDERTCGKAILGGYRPFSYLGFVIGTVYQYVLLKLVLTFVFDGVDSIPEYNFDLRALAISLVLFLLTYELILLFYAKAIGKLSLKSVMEE